MIRILFFLFLFSLAANPLHAAEKLSAGGACSSDANVLDWDTVWQCVGSVWARAALFIGTSTDTCDAAHAGKMRYNPTNMEYCNGSAWTVLTNSTTTPVYNAQAGTGYFVMSQDRWNGCGAVPISSVTHSGTTATITTTMNHGLAVGNKVTMSGMTISHVASGIYNVTAAVASVPSSTSFTYTMASNPGADPDVAAAGAAISSVTVSSTTATVNTSANHNLVTGQYITVINMIPVQYNGTYTVASVPTSTSFTYTLHGIDTPTSPPTTVGTYSSLVANYCYAIAQEVGWNTLCYNELTTNTNWKGYTTANSNGKLTASNIHQFECCNDNFPIYATYAFARIGNSSVGGATFTTDNGGIGPNDTNNWANYNYFGGQSPYWEHRYETSNTQWLNGQRSSGEDCTSWTAAVDSVSASYTVPNASDFTRWYGGSTASNYPEGTCSHLYNIVCIVGP